MSQHRRRILAALLVAAPGCLSVPASHPTSAASSGASAAPRAVLARATTDEPPLPGAVTAGWTGLGEPPPSDPHAHHHHTGMDMTGMDMGGAPPTESGEPAPDALPPEAPPPEAETEHNHGH